MSKEDYINDLSAIKDLMNKSSRFLSLSGLSGILAGVYALLGAGVTYYLANDINTLILNSKTVNYVLVILAAVAGLSIISAIAFSTRKAKKNNEVLWNSTSKRLIGSFLIPLITGGIYILIKLDHHHYGLTASLMLLFYGLALVNASKYTIGNVKYLGYAEIILGLICAAFPGLGFWFWVLGFGFAHVIYGALIYVKHDR